MVYCSLLIVMIVLDAKPNNLEVENIRSNMILSNGNFPLMPSCFYGTNKESLSSAALPTLTTLQLDVYHGQKRPEHVSTK